MNKVINFGVVGVGHIGKKHISCIESDPACNLVSVCDKKGLKYLHSIGLMQVDKIYYSSLNQMLSNKEIDVVSICTPNYLHASMAIECLSKKSMLLLKNLWL